MRSASLVCNFLRVLGCCGSAVLGFGWMDGRGWDGMEWMERRRRKKAFMIESMVARIFVSIIFL